MIFSIAKWILIGIALTIFGYVLKNIQNGENQNLIVNYNWINAAAYEVTNVLIGLQPKLEQNKWIKMIRSYCFPDWVEWKTERTMEGVDSQVAKLQQEMQERDEELYVKPIIIEHEPDGSEAQKLLGGELQIKAPWLDSSNQD